MEIKLKHKYGCLLSLLCYLCACVYGGLLSGLIYVRVCLLLEEANIYVSVYMCVGEVCKTLEWQEKKKKTCIISPRLILTIFKMFYDNLINGNDLTSWNGQIPTDSVAKTFWQLGECFLYKYEICLSNN